MKNQKIAKNNMPVKTSQVRIGRTTYIVSAYNCVFDEKDVKSKIERLIKNDIAKKTFDNSF